MRPALPPLLLALALVALAACGGGSGSTTPPQNGGLTGASPTGTVEGLPFAAADGGSLVVAPAPCAGGGNQTLGGLIVAFSSYPSFCAFKRGTACNYHPSSSELILYMVREAPSAPPAFAPGTYAIGYSSSAGVQTAISLDLRRLGSTCGRVTTFQSVTGTVTLDQVAPTVKGSLDATFWSGPGGSGTNLGSLTGPFDSGPCTLPIDFCPTHTGDACIFPACIP